jgi:hypothetical protein
MRYDSRSSISAFLAEVLGMASSPDTLELGSRAPIDDRL